MLKCCDVRAVCLQNGFTPLHGAARHGCLHIVRELIEKMNADILAQTSVRVALSDMCDLCIVSDAS